ncbi:MAG: ADP-ribosylglycohydrolase family protein [Candidatus Promineifilaceae bacterium]|nr:ADP-ribosylglycohydrolase family protein [Candidatus Promineifilaceae bacterium]
MSGLSIGDAFGQLFISRQVASEDDPPLPPGTWCWSDDTQLAVSIVDILGEYGHIEQGALAAAFARRYAKEPYRASGSGARRLPWLIGEGCDWRVEAPENFPGGSYGSGGDMDTTCAIVGGVVALAADNVPTAWQRQRERLPAEFDYA